MARSEVIPDIKKDHLKRRLAKGERLDGRGLEEYRPIKIEFGMLGKAEGSARVTIGNTSVYAGIKMGKGTPYSDSPNSGTLATGAELAPMASPVFETGPPREGAIELARVTDRAIREGQVVDMDELCITPGEQIWMMNIDLQPVDYDGNLFDACELAALSAIMCGKIPASKIEGQEDYPIAVKNYPITCTAVKIGDKVIFDPILDEELVAEARISVSTDQDGNIRAMQKGLSGGFTPEEVRKVIKTATSMGAKIRKQLFATAKEAGLGGPY